MVVGDYVKTWFDTGAMGVTTMYGRVIKSGRATYTVRWESGICNRVVQGYRGVDRVAAADVDHRAFLRLRTESEIAAEYGEAR